MPKASEPTSAVAPTVDPRLLPWSQRHIQAADACARAIHATLTSAPSLEGIVGDIDVCGSYMLRTAINTAGAASAGGALGAASDLVYPVDLSVTLSEKYCTQAQVDGGEYLDVRSKAVAAMVSAVAEAQNSEDLQAAVDEALPASAANSVRIQVNTAATVPLRSAPLFRESKRVVVVRFTLLRAPDAGASDDDDQPAATGSNALLLGGERTVRVDVVLHVRPAKVGMKISAEKGVKRRPWYANLVLEDHFAPALLHYLHTAIKRNPELPTAIVKAKLWARHVAVLAPPAGSCSDGTTCHGLSGFVLSCVAAACSDASAATTSSDALLRQLWIKLSAMPLALQAPNTFMNLCHVLQAHVEDPAVLDVAMAAKSALSVPTGLAHILSVPHPTHLSERFDHVVVLRSVAGTPLIATSALGRRLAEIPGNAAGDYPSGYAVRRGVHGLLASALGDRAGALRVLSTENASAVTVAVSFSSEGEARSRLLRGPPVENREAVAEFDELWGTDRTSSRQFADGGVFRCVLWPNPRPEWNNPTAELHDTAAAATLIEAILGHLVGRHFTGAAASVETTSFATELMTTLSEPADPLGVWWVDAAPICGPSVRVVFDTVQTLVRRVGDEKLPCIVKAVEPLSANLRGTEVFASLPSAMLLGLSDIAALPKQVRELVDLGHVTPIGQSVEPLHVALVIDDKKKIPDTTEAIARMKAAITAQLARALEAELKSDRNDNVRVLCAKQWVDILAYGYVVRLYLAHYREVSLLRALDQPAQADAIERRLFITARHSDYVKAVVQSHPSAAGAMRLLKRWVGAAMLSDYLLPEALELIVAAVYVQAGGYNSGGNGLHGTLLPPASAAEAFLRALRLLSDAASLTRQPIVLSTTTAEIRAAGDAKVASKALYPEQGLFISAPYMPDASPFTANTPRTAMVERLAALAGSALNRFAVAAACTFGALVLPELSAAAPPAGASTANHLLTLETVTPSTSKGLSAVNAVFSPLDCRSFDAVLPFTSRVRGACSTGTRGVAAAAPALTLRATTGDVPTTAARPPQKADGLAMAALGRLVAPWIEREPATAAVQRMRAAVRDTALLFYDAFAPTVVGVCLLRRRKAPLPSEWFSGLGLAPGAVVSQTTQPLAPAALNETITTIAQCVDACPGVVLAPPVIEQVQNAPGVRRTRPTQQPAEVDELVDEPAQVAEPVMQEEAKTPTAKKRHRADKASSAEKTPKPSEGNGKVTPAKAVSTTSKAESRTPQTNTSAKTPTSAQKTKKNTSNPKRSETSTPAENKDTAGVGKKKPKTSPQRKTAVDLL